MRSCRLPKATHQMTDDQPNNAVRPLSPQGKPLEVCSHCEVGHQFQLRRRIIRGGVVSLEWQCLECGRSTGQPVAKRLVPDWATRPDWDTALSTGYEAAAEEERLQAQQTKRAAYQAYLGSEGWQAKRGKVLRRDPICRSCEDAASEQVHHLTYERIFHEPLLDLVGVCRPCHRDIHRRSDLREAVDRAEPAPDHLRFD
jgi:hypothetical protein